MIVLIGMAMSCFARSDERVTYSAIAIDYIGESDGLVVPVLMGDSKTGAEWLRGLVMRPFKGRRVDTHIVSTSLVNDVIANVEAFENARQTSAVSRGHSAVQIFVVTPEKSGSFIYDAATALSLLEILQKTCPSDEALSEDVGYFQKRVVQYRSW